jgi:hypothetical protein
MGERTLINSTIPLDCAEADELSIAIGDGTYGRFPYSVELAFIKGGEFVEFPELADYDMHGVYGFVPLDYLADIINRFGDKS